MTSRTRNLVDHRARARAAGGLGAASSPTKPTVLGLDLRGGVELVYEGRPTPQVPEVTPETIDDAIETIRKRTDALGVSEPEIQRAGANQISIGLPDVDNADRAIEQVGTTAQLQFYDWEPNVLGRARPRRAVRGLQGALPGRPGWRRSRSPKAEADRRAAGRRRRRPHAARRPTARTTRRGDKFYLFGADQKLIAGPDASCEELLADFEGVRGPTRTQAQIPNDSECREELAGVPVGQAEPATDDDSANKDTGPPAGSEVLTVPAGHRRDRGRAAPRTSPRRCSATSCSRTTPSSRARTSRTRSRTPTSRPRSPS